MQGCRKAALAAGEKFYFTGKPCPYGHVCERYVSNKQCKLCNSERRRERYQNDPGYVRRILDQQKEYVEENKEEVRERQRARWADRWASDLEWRKAEGKRIRAIRKKRMAEDPEYRKAEGKKKYLRDKKRRARDPAYVARRNADSSARYVKRYHSNPMFRMDRTVSTCITQTLKSKGLHSRRRTWHDLVGFTLEELKAHLEKQFRPGMTWENYGPVWHIDHIKPRSKCDTFEEAWQLSNLQPLFARENIVKSDKWDKAGDAAALGV